MRNHYAYTNVQGKKEVTYFLQSVKEKYYGIIR